MAETGLARRWFAFNGVGSLGVVLQLAALAALTSAGVHTLVATAIAVEAAILHNFLWHQRWTWRDRPAGSSQSTIARLVRFHAMNGVISMAGNIALMTILTPLGIRPLPANAIAIGLCSLLNFAASETVVFKAARVATGVALAIAIPAARTVPLSASSAADMATAELTRQP